MSELLAGFAAIPFQPPPGSSRSSWGIYQVTPREHAAPLMVRGTLLSCGGERAFVVTVDACLIDDVTARACRDAAGAQLGIGREQVVLHCTHTHEGPYSFVGANAGIGSALIEALRQCALKSAADLQPVTVSLGQTATRALNINRRRPREYADPRVSVVRFDGKSGPRAIWLHFTAHPLTAMGYDDHWSADFPGYACEHLSSALPGTHAQFIQGAAGDVAPLDWCFGNERPALPVHDDTARWLGERLAREVTALLPRLTAVRATALSIRSRSLGIVQRKFWFSRAELVALISELAPRIEKYPPKPWGSRLHVATVAETESEVYMLTGAQYILSIWEEQGRIVTSDIQVLRLGELALATTPGELFSALGKAITDDRSEPTLVAGYCNAYTSYIPTRRALEEVDRLPLREWIDQKKYRWAYGATITTSVGPEAGEMIVDAVKSLF